jgi:glycosyltransferase involved in cell wall biosynthesis
VRLVKLLAGLVLDGIALTVLAVRAQFTTVRGRSLIWGPTPIVNNKYWSLAMRQAGWDSRTLMHSVSSINSREDYDLMFDDVTPSWIWPASLRRHLMPYAAFAFCLRNAAVLHISFEGGPLGYTRLRRFEAPLLRRAGVKTVVLPYGGDFFMFSRIADPVVRHGLLLSYPQLAALEPRIAAHVEYWTENADAIIAGFIYDGLPRWDVILVNFICIDLDAWRRSGNATRNDGRHGPVRILHSPNHREVKGTRYLEQAIGRLQAEGLQIEPVVLEGVPNEQVRAALAEVDLVADQFILHGYGLAGIEAMASGLPVLCNLEDDAATRLLHTVSFYAECPVISVTPETLETALRTLIMRPDLRDELGSMGRAYVEKYHSYSAAQHLFGTLYRRLLDGEDVDFAGVFDPLSSEYVLSSPPLEPPLDRHRLRESDLVGRDAG